MGTWRVVSIFGLDEYKNNKPAGRNTSSAVAVAARPHELSDRGSTRHSRPRPAPSGRFNTKTAITRERNVVLPTDRGTIGVETGRTTLVVPVVPDRRVSSK